MSILNSPHKYSPSLIEATVTHVDPVRYFCTVTTVNGKLFHDVKWVVPTGGSTSEGFHMTPNAGDQVLVTTELGYPLILGCIPRANIPDAVISSVTNSPSTTLIPGDTMLRGEVVNGPGKPSDFSVGDLTYSTSSGNSISILKGGVNVFKASSLSQLVMSKYEKLVRVVASNYQRFSDGMSEVTANVAGRMYTWRGFDTDIRRSIEGRELYNEVFGDVAAGEVLRGSPGSGTSSPAQGSVWVKKWLKNPAGATVMSSELNASGTITDIVGSSHRTMSSSNIVGSVGATAYSLTPVSYSVRSISITSSGVLANTVSAPFVMLGVGGVGNLSALPASAAGVLSRVSSLGPASLMNNPIASLMNNPIASLMNNPIASLMNNPIVSQVTSVMSKVTGGDLVTKLTSAVASGHVLSTDLTSALTGTGVLSGLTSLVGASGVTLGDVTSVINSPTPLTALAGLVSSSKVSSTALSDAISAHGVLPDLAGLVSGGKISSANLSTIMGGIPAVKGIVDLFTSSTISNGDLHSLIGAIAGPLGIPKQAKDLLTHTDLLSGIAAVNSSNYTAPNLKSVLAMAGQAANVLGGAAGSTGDVLNSITSSLNLGTGLAATASSIATAAADIASGRKTPAQIIASITAASTQVSGSLSSDITNFSVLKDTVAKASSFLSAVGMAKNPDTAVSALINQVMKPDVAQALRSIPSLR